MTLTITPFDYQTDDTKRATADRVMELAGLDRNDVAHIEHDEPNVWRFKVWERDPSGKRYLDDAGVLAHRWVEITE